MLADTEKVRTNVKDRSGRPLAILDEPVTHGGTDMGPTPLQGLLGCFAGCENVTARKHLSPYYKIRLIINVSQGSLQSTWEYI